MHPKWQSNTSILQFRLILDCLEICTNKITWSIVVASSVQVAPERILFVGANPQSPKIIPFTNSIHVKEHLRIVECLLILPHFFSGEPVLRVQALFCSRTVAYSSDNSLTFGSLDTPIFWKASFAALWRVISSRWASKNAFLAWCWAFSDYSDFQRMKQCAVCR